MFPGVGGLYLAKCRDNLMLLGYQIPSFPIKWILATGIAYIMQTLDYGIGNQITSDLYKVQHTQARSEPRHKKSSVTHYSHKVVHPSRACIFRRERGCRGSPDRVDYVSVVSKGRPEHSHYRLDPDLNDCNRMKEFPIHIIPLH